MVKVRVSHFFQEHMPGAVVDVSPEMAERIVAGRGGVLVAGESVETATDRPVAVETRDEPALEEPDDVPAKKARRGKG